MIEEHAMKFKKSIACIALCCLLLSCLFATGCGGATPGNTPGDANITYSDDPFFAAENWVYMTNNNGATVDGGSVPYSLDDGTIKFHNANQAYDCGKDLSNDSVEFMLKGSKNWQIWFLANTVDNNALNCYKLVCKDGELFVTTSETDIAIATAKVTDTEYTPNAWNKFQLDFSVVDNVCTIGVYVNDERVIFSGTPFGGAEVIDGDFVHTRTSTFVTGNYICVKVWYGDCFLQLRSVDDASKPEVQRIACIGDSITYGANADNSYTDSYPAQLQKLYGGKYNVMNFGKSGATVRDTADDPYRKTPEYEGMKLFAPDRAIIMLGSNDSKTYQVPTAPQIYAALCALIDDIYALNANAEIRIATSPYAYSTAYQISNANIESTIIPAQRDAAEHYGLPLTDMHEYTKNMNGNYADGIHPKSKGYTYIAYRFHCDLEDITPDEDYVASFKD